MKSLLFQEGATPFTDPPGNFTGRMEIPVTLRKGGRLYRYVIRDKVQVEDPYLVLVKARAFSIRTGEPYAANPPSRSIRDFLLKGSLVI